MATYSMEGVVLVPVDFSEDSLQAVRDTLTMVSDPGNLHVLTVLTPDPAGGDEERRLSHLRAELDRVLDHEITTGAQLHARCGAPAETICAVAAELNAGTIVIPAHGKDATPASQLGTVTGDVVRMARCPVLVIGRRS